MDVHIGRQPILDRSDAVLGYELLFRDDGDNAEATKSSDQATARVFVNTFLEFGLAELVGSHLAFVNVTRPFLTGEYPLPFAPGQVVLEILESVDLDDTVVTSIEQLAQQGYTIALDHYTVGRVPARVLDIVQYVKCDADDRAGYSLELTVAQLRAYPHLVLIAQRVETEVQFNRCRDLGFDYFQGFLFSRPRMLTRRSVGPNRLACLELMCRLTSADVGAAEIEECIRLEPALTYRLLRVINSAAGGLPREITSLRQAIVLLGQRTIRNWTTLLLLADADPGNVELLTTTLTRARMCELLARENGTGPDGAFMVGLLSGLDLLFDEPLPTLVDRLALDAELKAALLRHHGPLGQILATTLAYEQGIHVSAERPRPGDASLSHIYLGAVGWSMQVARAEVGEPTRS
jgi:EAL and modified HD-GYP domain-containing signal transduction protein